MAASLTHSAPNDRRSIGTTNKPGARKLMPVTAPEALSILQSAIGYCQMAGMAVQAANSPHGLTLTVPGAFFSLSPNGTAAEFHISTPAERKAGELLEKMERKQGGNGKFGTVHTATVQTASEYRTVQDEQEISNTQAHRWQTIATLPEEKFEQHIAEVKNKKRRVTELKTYVSLATGKQEACLERDHGDRRYYTVTRASFERVRRVWLKTQKHSKHKAAGQYNLWR